MRDKILQPEVIVFAGPNGSGKSTIARMAKTVGAYINADDIKQASLCSGDALHFVAESADLALASARASMRTCVYWGDLSCEDTRRYVIRRENELQWEEIYACYQRVIEKAKA